ncbi:MAG TPA: GDCCVxC domain-containing (seleno)protein [Rudaea sp.]|nr:GDCCVxC domain-containing (seleno)protein [Rudaea sp.]
MSGDVVLTSTLTCPHCGLKSIETMPVNACIWFHDCPGCGALLRPLPGHCCVFCSYGSVPCPPVQMGTDCCRPTG